MLALDENEALFDELFAFVFVYAATVVGISGFDVWRRVIFRI